MYYVRNTDFETFETAALVGSKGGTRMKLWVTNEYQHSGIRDDGYRVCVCVCVCAYIYTHTYIHTYIGIVSSIACLACSMEPSIFRLEHQPKESKD